MVRPRITRSRRVLRPLALVVASVAVLIAPALHPAGVFAHEGDYPASSDVVLLTSGAEFDRGGSRGSAGLDHIPGSVLLGRSQPAADVGCSAPNAPLLAFTDGCESLSLTALAEAFAIELPPWQDPGLPMAADVAAVDAASFTGQFDAAPHAGLISAAGLAWPMTGLLTSFFGAAHPLGIDLAAQEGWPVVSAADGRIVSTGFHEGYGNFVVINHPNGYATLYGHFMRPGELQIGDVVRRGQLIGYVGNTGHSTGPHLHFEVHYLDRLVDPLAALPRVQLLISPEAYRPIAPTGAGPVCASLQPCASPMPTPTPTPTPTPSPTPTATPVPDATGTPTPSSETASVCPTRVRVTTTATPEPSATPELGVQTTATPPTSGSSRASSAAFEPASLTPGGTPVPVSRTISPAVTAPIPSSAVTTPTVPAPAPTVSLPSTWTIPTAPATGQVTPPSSSTAPTAAAPTSSARGLDQDAPAPGVTPAAAPATNPESAGSSIER